MSIQAWHVTARHLSSLGTTAPPWYNHIGADTCGDVICAGRDLRSLLGRIIAHVHDVAARKGCVRCVINTHQSSQAGKQGKPLPPVLKPVGCIDRPHQEKLRVLEFRYRSNQLNTPWMMVFRCEQYNQHVYRYIPEHIQPGRCASREDAEHNWNTCKCMHRCRTDSPPPLLSAREVVAACCFPQGWLDIR